jgi:gliding motility-associated lipoprotein GldH
MKKLSVLFFALLLVFGFAGCNNPNALVDVYTPIDQHDWTYTHKVSVPVEIEDSTAVYKVLLNLRHTADYKYANIFIRIREVHPNRKTKTYRKEFRLANPDGEWLGTGSGNLITHVLPVYTKLRFTQKGTYVFELEQNMRDNPLREISDVGLRVEKVN